MRQRHSLSLLVDRLGKRQVIGEGGGRLELRLILVVFGLVARRILAIGLEQVDFRLKLIEQRGTDIGKRLGLVGFKLCLANKF